MNSNEALAYLRSLPGETISPKELAMVAGGSPYSYNLAAKEGKLDLPHLWRGRNLRIWKGPVIRLIGGQDVQAVSDGRREANEGQDDPTGSGRVFAFPSYADWRKWNDRSSPLGSDMNESQEFHANTNT